MANTITQGNLKKCLTTAFYIPPKEGCEYINIKDIHIDNQLNQVDYKTNYFAFLRKEVANGKSPTIAFCYCDNRTHVNYYLLTVVRIPIKQYKNKEELVTAINKSYSRSIFDCLLNDYMEKSILSIGNNVFDIYVVVKRQQFFEINDKYNITLEEGSSINRRTKSILVHPCSYSTNIVFNDRRITISESNSKVLKIEIRDIKYGTEIFNLYYSFSYNNVTAANNSIQTAFTKFFEDHKLFTFVCNYTPDPNKYDFYFYSNTNTDVEPNTPKVMVLTIDNDNFLTSRLLDYNGIAKYSNIYTNLIDYTFVDNTGNEQNPTFNSVKTVTFIDKTIDEQIHIIDKYTPEEIVFDIPILPVSADFSAVVDINSPYNDYNKSLEYTTNVCRQQLYYNNNVIKSLSNDVLVYDMLENDCFYSSFNINLFNAMNYISPPEHSIHVTTNNIYSINNKFVNVIRGNYMTSYIYDSPTIYDYHKGKDVLLEDITFSKSYKIYDTANFPDNEELKVSYIYNDKIDMILNNNDIHDNIVFNNLSTIKYDKNNNTLPIHQNVRISDKGVYIYITGSEFFQWPFTSTEGSITYNYIN